MSVVAGPMLEHPLQELPIGSPVSVANDDGTFWSSTTTSLPWKLLGYMWVVTLTGMTTCIELSRIIPVPPPEVPMNDPATALASASSTPKRKHLIQISMIPEIRAIATLKGQSPTAFAEEAVAEKVARMKAALQEAAGKA